MITITRRIAIEIAIAIEVAIAIEKAIEEAIMKPREKAVEKTIARKMAIEIAISIVIGSRLVAIDKAIEKARAEQVAGLVAKMATVIEDDHGNGGSHCADSEQPSWAADAPTRRRRRALPHCGVAKTARFSPWQAFAVGGVAPPGSACGLNGEMAKAAKWRWAAAN